ncbi:MAG: hypothetical protein EHM45_18765 [Desulfobacteraceae bacterium]|nr:MAG: hypothetical protein EHM45_18765 [Desulfobacteraceae bacterium]
MAIIKNKLKQRITIELEEGKSIGLLAEGKVKIADAVLDSPLLKRSIDRGEIVVLASGSEKKGRDKDPDEYQERKGKK